MRDSSQSLLWAQEVLWKWPQKVSRDGRNSDGVSTSSVGSAIIHKIYETSFLYFRSILLLSASLIESISCANHISFDQTKGASKKPFPSQWIRMKGAERERERWDQHKKKVEKQFSLSSIYNIWNRSIARWSGVNIGQCDHIWLKFCHFGNY